MANRSKLKSLIDQLDELEGEELEDLKRAIDRRLGDDDSTEDDDFEDEEGDTDDA